MGCGGGLVGGLAPLLWREFSKFRGASWNLKRKLFLFSLEIDRPMLIRTVVTFGGFRVERKVSLEEVKKKV